MRQGKNLVSNSDFNRKRGEEYLISSSFASENIVGGGQLRSTKVNASSRSIRNGKRAYAHFKGGEGNYASLMSSDFADTWTMLTPDYCVRGRKTIFAILQSKGGKPLFRLASYTRNVEGGGRLICHLLGLMFKPSFIGGVF